MPSGSWLPASLSSSARAASRPTSAWPLETVVSDGVEIDAPRLRRFSFKGQILSLSFRSQPPELEQVDLYNERWANYADLDLATFWRMARSFSSAKEITLWVNHLEEVALLTEASRVEHLPVFRRLRRLEIHGVYWMKGDTAAVTIVNLLRSCPMLTPYGHTFTISACGQKWRGTWELDGKDVAVISAFGSVRCPSWRPARWSLRTCHRLR